uniref:hypothetical protein n=1 Tax=Escherichia coli TaxID=562 RepID=UPI0022810834
QDSPKAELASLRAEVDEIDQQVQRIRRLAEEAGVPPALAETILREVIDTVVDHHTRLRERPYS